MPATTLSRRQPPINFKSGSAEIVQISKGNLFRDLIIRLTGGLTLAAVSNTRALTLLGDEWAAVAKIRIVANSSDVLFEMSGNQLYWLNRDFMGTNPSVTPALGDGVTANPTFDSCLVIPFWAMRNAKAADGSFDSGNLRDFRIEITWNPATAINAAATYATNPSIELGSYEAEDSSAFSPLYIPRAIASSKVYAAAVAADRYALDIGPSYKGFLIIAKNQAGTQETPGVITNLKLVSGSRVYREYTEQMLFQYATFRHDVPFQQFPTPVMPGVALVHAVGVADGTVDDVGAAFAQATLNNNFKELTTKLNQLQNLLSGNIYQGNVRQSAVNNHKAVYPLNLCPDGYVTEAINTNGFDDFYFEIATNAAATIEVVSLQMLPPRRKAA
jgi:hypothetical protein